MHDTKAIAIAGALALAMTSAAAAQDVTLHMAHNAPTADPVHTASEEFAAAVDELSGGSMEVIVYPSEQLANLRAGAEGVQLGTVDMAWSDSGTLGNWAPQYSFVSLPFMFEDFDSAVAAMDGLADEIASGMRSDLNVERLAWSPGGFRVILSATRPISSAADLDGFKIRVPEIPIYVSAFAALNANATPLPWGDVYSGLQTGLVEGVEGPPSSIVAAKFHEVSTHMAKTNHIMLDLNLLMNLDRFNALTSEQQDILRQAGTRAAGKLRELKREGYDGAYQNLADVLEANDTPDVESFRQAMAPVYDEFIASAGGQAAEWISAVPGQ